MRSDASSLKQGARLVAVTPSRLGKTLGEALGAAANLRGIPLVDPSSIAGGMPSMEDDALVVCAHVGNLDSWAPFRMAAVLSEPERASRWVAQSNGCTDWEGLLIASGSFAHALDAARRRKAPVFRDVEFRADPEATLSSLLRLLDIEPDPVLFEGHARAFGETVRGLLTQDALPGDGVNMFDRALSIYGTQNSGLAPSAWWDRVLFRWGDHPQESCPLSIDVTGPPRDLVFGPYVSLTAGAWRAEVELELCEQAARRSYLVDFGSDRGTSRAAVGPLKTGRNVVSLSHHFDAAAPAWIRIFLARAAFHGELRFRGATITRLDPPPV